MPGLQGSRMRRGTLRDEASIAVHDLAYTAPVKAWPLAAPASCTCPAASLDWTASGRGRLPGRRLRRQRISAQRERNVADGFLRPHAVAGLVERRGDHG